MRRLVTLRDLAKLDAAAERPERPVVYGPGRHSPRPFPLQPFRRTRQLDGRFEVEASGVVDRAAELADVAMVVE